MLRLASDGRRRKCLERLGSRLQPGKENEKGDEVDGNNSAAGRAGLALSVAISPSPTSGIGRLCPDLSLTGQQESFSGAPQFCRIGAARTLPVSVADYRYRV